MPEESFIAKRHASKEDCLGCRLVSGGGLVGISLYTYLQARNHAKFNKFALIAVSTGVASIGVARLLNLYPFGTED